VSFRWELRATLPPCPDVLERFFRDFRGQESPAGAEWFAAELLLREALENAVSHGCCPGGGIITCVVRRRPGRLLIVVCDDGNGFDWRAASGREPSLTETHGRGLAILRQYASRVRFNDKGNQVAIWKRLPEKGRQAPEMGVRTERER
jgi:anti-sigma regulatory factor (Ser/Thr protein kinase)